LLIERAAKQRTILRENEILRQQIQETGVSQDRIIYKSPKMAELINLVGRIAMSRTSVLIQGESGTGKELIAGLIHRLSPRKGGVLITVNCAALPESLLESELFGHEKGSFTGATQRRLGRFELSDKGTLFLDEIGELSPSVQVKLLRFLQGGEFQRVGGNLTLKADVRIISATNRDLQKRVKEGKFREDLFFRLNVVTLTVPPLRDRRDDISPLTDHFIKKYSIDNGKAIEGISSEARDMLIKYDYPGNVRELENIMERAVVISRGPVISVEDLPFTGRMDDCDDKVKINKGGLKERLDSIEKEMISKAMIDSGNIQTRAADMLGISERMLRYKLKKYGLK